MKNPLDQNDILEFFLTRFATGTQSTYRRHLKAYLRHLSDRNIDLSLTTENEIKEYLNQRSTNLRASATRLLTAAIKSFHRYAFENGFLDTNPAAKIILPKQRNNKLPVDKVSKSDVETLLNSIDLTTLKGIRHHALISVIFYCYLKISEALDLRYYNLVGELQMDSIEITSPGRGRLIPIKAETRKSLLRLIEVMPNESDPSGIIFAKLGGKGSYFIADKPFDISQANTQLRLLRDQAGLGPNITLEGIRQSGIRSFVESGGDLFEARRLYGCSFDNLEQIIM